MPIAFIGNQNCVTQKKKKMEINGNKKKKKNK